jgi:hypothetical protein
LQRCGKKMKFEKDFGWDVGMLGEWEMGNGIME